MSSLDDEWKQFLQSQSSVGFSLADSFNPSKSKDLSTIRNLQDLEVKRPTSLRTVATSLRTVATSLRTVAMEPTGDSYENHNEKNVAERPKRVDGKATKNKKRETDTLETDNTLETDTPESAVPSKWTTNELYISTKTKVLFLNQEIDIKNVFWKIPVEEYWKPVDCVVKKQMKIVSKSPEEYAEIVEKLEKIPYYTENIIKQINNPTARRIKFKDERKITVGISKKDIMNARGKVKNAFYNCFAIIVRFRYEGSFREIHVKVFNTGKLEIPGVLNAEILEIMRGFILRLLEPYTETPLAFIEPTSDDNVLINSNFNCGFYIHREKLFSILRSEKYGIETSYDPCIYPGIKCKYYFNMEVGFTDEQTGKITFEDRGQKMCELGNNKKYTEVSFMIFRTGSCLIVGNCSERILLFIFEFIKQLLIDEYPIVAVPTDEPATKIKKTKLRKKSINVSANYHTTITTA